MMGSPGSDEDADDDERPQHRVRITKPFYLGATEVTQGQWEAVMGTRPWEGNSHVRTGTDYPATHVSWGDAVEFCQRLGKKENATYRLPSEAEWEYACRAGTTTAYHFGDDTSPLGEYAWFGGLSGDGNCRNERYAHQVARKKPNSWGLYDMHGNVWEWCRDWHADDYYAGSDAADPNGAASGTHRVIRGGCWLYPAENCRSAYRSEYEPANRRINVGFRLACSRSGRPRLSVPDP
jgi:formylglycine-generating enzyme required for sulfatase activity